MKLTEEFKKSYIPIVVTHFDRSIEQANVALTVMENIDASSDIECLPILFLLEKQLQIFIRETSEPDKVNVHNEAKRALHVLQSYIDKEKTKCHHLR